jgi:signal transduction histidine kinase
MGRRGHVTTTESAAICDDDLTVLLVEDEPMLSKAVGQLLDEAGYRHVTIADHNQIADAVQRWHPQCVILDSEPRVDGRGRSWEDAAAIRIAHPELPVLMFTADTDSMAEARAGTSARSKVAGFAGVMDKPFLVTEFLATLKHAVETQHPAVPPDAKNHVTGAITVFPAVGGEASAMWAPTDFFSTAVHELRTPLTSVLGQAQLARRYIEHDPARALDAIDRTIEQAKHMNRLVGELLDHARITVGALSLQVVTFDLGFAIAAAIPQYEHGDLPRITFQHPSEAVQVRGDPDRIAQIVGNLLDNALKYSDLGSPVAVSLTIVGNEAYVRVQDAGIGIAVDERDRIFAPFYRSSRTRDMPGTGLGLHISRRLAEQHRGRLWLENSEDRESVFTLALPLAESMQEKPPPGTPR